MADIIDDGKRKKEDPPKKDPHSKDETVTHYGSNSVRGIVQAGGKGGDFESYYERK